MRLFFEDPDGQRLALDANRREWAATYEADDTIINNDHFIIRVEAPEVLRRIEQEADFNGYGYNKNLADRQRTTQKSVYAEYLQRLADFIAKAENAGEYDDGPTAEELFDELNNLKRRIDSAKQTGYFDAEEYAALILILDTAENIVDLYNRSEGPGRNTWSDPDPEPF